MFQVDLTRRFSSSFDMEAFMPFSKEAGGYDILDSTFMRDLGKLRAQGIKEITDEELRWDLLSFRLYRDVGYWWVLMLYNDVVDPTELVRGMRIRYFALFELEKFFFELRARA